MGSSLYLEWWLKKVLRITRERYDKLVLQATRVKIKDLDEEFYDVYIFEPVTQEILYMDCLDKGDLDMLVHAARAICLSNEYVEFSDGFMFKLEGCRVKLEKVIIEDGRVIKVYRYVESEPASQAQGCDL